MEKRMRRSFRTKDKSLVMKRFPFDIFIVFLIVIGSLSACNKMAPPKNPIEEEQKKVLSNKGRLIKDLASPANMMLAKVEGVCLIEGLANTGADEPPSTYQEMVYQELQRDDEKKRTARQRIASETTAIGMVSVVVPPGARKGDVLDAEVSLIPGSTATSIEGGYVENARLHQFLLADQIRKGAVDGLVSGRIFLDPELLARDDPIALKNGKIIHGAVIVRDRPIWLTIREEERSAGIAKRIEDVVNSRFSYKKNGYKQPVATAKYGAARIDLVVPDEYRDNINRYVNVILQIAFFESPSELQQRLEELRVKLLDPDTSEFASFQLEAIGPNNPLVVEAVAAGLGHPSEVVRYNSAICMAYLNASQYRVETARVLASLAEEYPTYRPSCLAVLGTCLKTTHEADQVLRNLLASSNSETRYGAFRALWTRNPDDFMIQGEKMGDFSYHCLNCGGPALIHVTKSKRPEIVLFSKEDLYLSGRFELDAGSRITVRNQDGGVVVKHYKNGLDEERIVGYDLDSVIRAIVEVGGTYPNVVEFLVNAKKGDAIKMASRDGREGGVPANLAFDALPGLEKFRRVHDISEMEKELVAENEERKKNSKDSLWSKINPVGWFTKKEDEESNETFDGGFDEESEDASAFSEEE